MTHPCKRAFQFIFIRIKQNTLVVQYVCTLLFYTILSPPYFTSVEPSSGGGGERERERERECVCARVCARARPWGWFFYTHSFYFYFFIFYIYSACSITVSSTTCCCNLTFLLLVFIYICSVEWYIFSRSIEFMYLMNCFRFPLVSSLLLAGHLSTLSTLLFRISLSFLSLLHWNIRWSTVCMPCLHGHPGLSIIFNRCR
jgi:hypothetical protein